EDSVVDAREVARRLAEIHESIDPFWALGQSADEVATLVVLAHVSLAHVDLSRPTSPGGVSPPGLSAWKVREARRRSAGAQTGYPARRARQRGGGGSPGR